MRCACVSSRLSLPMVLNVWWLLDPFSEEMSCCKTKGHYNDVHRTNFFRSYVLAKTKKTAIGMAINSKESVYRVDSGASLHMMGSSSLNHRERRTIRHSCTILDIQTANRIAVSDTQAKLYIKEPCAHLWIHLLIDSPSVLWLARLCNEFGSSYSWTAGKTPRLSKGKRAIECNIDIVVPVLAVTKLKDVPSIEFPTSQGKTFSENEKRRTPMLDLLKPFSEGFGRTRCILPSFRLRQLEVTLRMKLSKNNFLMRNFRRWSPMRAEIL